MYKTIQMTQILKKVWVVLVLTSFITHAQDATISNDLWHHQDLKEDSIPGVSLNKAYKELLKDKKGQEIIVAVIDTEVDINHEDLKDQIWSNPKEIPNNGIDDDNNGYIDDIHGWNFIGNNKGENVIYANVETTRILRTYKNKFEGKTIEQIDPKDTIAYIDYSRAKERFKVQLKKATEDKEYGENMFKKIQEAKKELVNYFPNEAYTKENLSKIDTSNTDLKPHIAIMSQLIAQNTKDEELREYLKLLDAPFKYYLNTEYNERSLIDDNPADISDTNYGNNNVTGNLKELYHGTLVSGVIAATRGNQIGIDGFSNQIQLMPLCISANGDEHDKDIALAIRYAVDNGAKVINMSSGKNFSLHESWVNDALTYAAKKDVLFISAAGNDYLNLDQRNSYPNDQLFDGLERVNNCMLIGGSSKKINKKLSVSFSNYGKSSVDLFAPGIHITTTARFNKYEKVRGTSYAAPIVSGIAALIRSHYPSISASQVKQILMDSGISYDIKVRLIQEDRTKKMVPFSELSKSGKIVNAYNALLMAEEVAKRKK